MYIYIYIYIYVVLIYIYIYIYGSVRHQLLEKEMEFFWIPEDIKNLISSYFKCTYMRFSNNEYLTYW